MSSLPLTAFALVLLLGAAPALDYDSFCDAEGHIRAGHVEAAQAMAQRPELLEQLYADATRGDSRAARAFQELETQYFPAIGRTVAEETRAIPCSIPVYRELSGRCIPNWAFLDFLSKDKPGGIRLRTALGNAYQARARELGLEDAMILSVVNALMAGVIVKGTMAGPEARSSTTSTRLEAPKSTSPPIGWPPEPPRGPKPGLEEPGAAQWRYQRYLHEQHAAGKQPHEILDFRKWKPVYFDPALKGGRPGRPGGPAQVATRQSLTEEGFINTESKRLGENFVDLYRPNAAGGVDYVEVDEMLKSGIPRADVRAKLKKELAHLEKNDTLLFVDKAEPSKRILYRFGEAPSIVDTRTCQSPQ
jgi:hypothetical protein